MQLATKYFGEIDYSDGDLLHFPCGLFGFELERRFLLLPFHGSGGGLLCFQSVDTPALAFVAMDPFLLKPDYAPMLEEATLREMGVQESQDLSYYALCVVKNPVASSTVNLRCPLAINSSTRIARQIILESGEYEMRHLLSQFKGGGGGLC